MSPRVSAARFVFQRLQSAACLDQGYRNNSGKSKLDGHNKNADRWYGAPSQQRQK
jgi:hypothetical protein